MAGMLYYQLDAGDHTATKRMIVVKKEQWKKKKKKNTTNDFKSFRNF
jgi:hypothetical protein